MAVLVTFLGKLAPYAKDVNQPNPNSRGARQLQSSGNFSEKSDFRRNGDAQVGFIS